MKKVLLLSNDMMFNYRLNMIYDRSEYQITLGEISYPEAYNYIYKNTYDVIFIHYSFITQNYQLFDKLISSRKWIVVYASNKMEIGMLYNVISSPRFYMMSDNRIESFNEILSILIKEVGILESYEEDIRKLHIKLDEELYVKKAKMYLINECNMLEDEAYKYIIHYAMDNRLSKLNAAKEILDSKKDKI